MLKIAFLHLVADVGEQARHRPQRIVTEVQGRLLEPREESLP